MNPVIFWFFVIILTLTTLFNYWLVGDHNGWGSGSSGHYASTGSWHK